jgi:hypothetical protein
LTWIKFWWALYSAYYQAISMPLGNSESLGNILHLYDGDFDRSREKYQQRADQGASRFLAFKSGQGARF